MLNTIAIEGYRSLRDIVIPLDNLTVITGANGSGKTNLYRAFRLLAGIADGQLIGQLAREGGLNSVLWAGPEQFSRAMLAGDAPVQGLARRTKPVSLQFGFTTAELGYLIDIGLPIPAIPTRSLFTRDPQIKREVIFTPPSMQARNSLTKRPAALDPRRSMLCETPDDYCGEISKEIRSWRFYDSFRTDALAPCRFPQIGTWTPALDHDGTLLAPAIQTIQESSWQEPFDAAIADAFDGCCVSVVEQNGWFSVVMNQPGMLRPLSTSELSDGTLRFLLLAAALQAPQAPGLIVINEPETSVHPDVIPALARLITVASRRSQIICISHDPALISALSTAGALHHHLEKRLGETIVSDQGLLTRPAWNWGARSTRRAF
ncbi:MAG: AAA family ATPase [Propionibacteriaceae bacterium]